MSGGVGALSTVVPSASVRKTVNRYATLVLFASHPEPPPWSKAHHCDG